VGLALKAPAELKVMRVRECPAPADLIDTPERAVEYYRANFLKADSFDPTKEAFIVFILNTRRRIIGHNLVAARKKSNATRPRFNPSPMARNHEAKNY
jgi:hypothetical protein